MTYYATTALGFKVGDKVRLTGDKHPGDMLGEVVNVIGHHWSAGMFGLHAASNRYWTVGLPGYTGVVVERDGRVIPEALLPGDVVLSDGTFERTVLSVQGRLVTFDRGGLYDIGYDYFWRTVSFVRPAHPPGTLGAITEDGPLPLKAGHCGRIAWWTPPPHQAPERATSIADAALRGIALEIDLREEYAHARAFWARESVISDEAFRRGEDLDGWTKAKAAELRESLESEARRTLREWPTRAGVPLRLVVLGNNNGLFTAAWEEP